MTDKEIDKIKNNETFKAAKLYVMETNKTFNDEGYTCVNVSDLVSYGYLNYETYEEKTIKVIRNNNTKVITNIDYVETCE